MHQAITWTNDHSFLQCHMEPLGHNGLINVGTKEGATKTHLERSIHEALDEWQSSLFMQFAGILTI